MKYFLKLYCWMFGCWFMSDHEGEIKCVRCGREWPDWREE